MGGPDKVRRQNDGGRLTVRERIDRMLRQGGFHQIGAITGTAAYDDEGHLVPSNRVMGRGRIDGRVDPRDTRKLLCEFATLAEPLRIPGPSAFPIRP